MTNSHLHTTSSLPSTYAHTHAFFERTHSHAQIHPQTFTHSHTQAEEELKKRVAHISDLETQIVELKGAESHVTYEFVTHLCVDVAH